MENVDPTTWQPWLDVLRNVFLFLITTGALGASLKLGRFFQKLDHLDETVTEFAESNHDAHEKIRDEQGHMRRDMLDRFRDQGERLARVETHVETLCAKKK